jgi:hypothetical protein
VEAALYNTMLLVNTMILVQIERNRRRFEIVGSLVSALVIGTALWMMSQSSMEPISPRDRLWLITYILTAACCYLFVYWVLDRYHPIYIKGFRLNWVGISSVGTTLAFGTLTGPTWLQHGSLTQEYLFAILSLLSFLNVVMFGVMAFVSSVGFIVNIILKEIDATKVVLD